MKPIEAMTEQKQRLQDIHTQIFQLLYTVISSLLLFVLLWSYSGIVRVGDRVCLEIAVLSALVTVLYCLRDLINRFVLLCFNVTYFLFLLGGIWVHMIDGGYATSYLGVPQQAATHTVHVLAISLLVVNTVFILLEKPSRSTLERWAQKRAAAKPRDPLPQLTRQIILAMFLVTLVAKLIGALIQYRFTVASSYVDSYVTNYDKPIYVWLPESIFYFSLCLWLAIKPSKKAFFLLMLPLLVIEVIILLSGDRGEPVCTALMLFFYVYHRGKNDDRFFRIKMGYVVLALAMLPLMIIGLQTVKYTRVHQTVETDSNLLLEFIEDQGVSASVIAKAYVYRDAIEEIGGSSYALGPLRGYIEHNMLSRVLFGTEEINSNTVEAALSGESLGETIAYLWIRQSYLQGIGCGSSYIAEFYHDGGIPYLIVGSIALAALLVFLVRVLQNSQSVFELAFALMAFRILMFIPRDNAFRWLTSTFSAQNLLVLLVLLLVTGLIRNKEKRVGQYDDRPFIHAHGR